MRFETVIQHASRPRLFIFTLLHRYGTQADVIAGCSCSYLGASSLLLLIMIIGSIIYFEIYSVEASAREAP